MNPTKRPHSSKIRTLTIGLKQRVQQLQTNNLTLTQLSQEAEDFLALVKEFKAARIQRIQLIRRIESGLAEACGELQAYQQTEMKCTLRDRLKMVQDLVKGHCVKEVKVEQLPSGEELSHQPADLAFFSPPSPS